MRREILPRGHHYRNGSRVISFAYQGKITYLTLGPCSLEFAKEQRAIIKMQIRQGTYQPKPRASKTPTQEPTPVCKVKDLWEPYLRNYKNLGGRHSGRQTIAWNYLAPIFGTVLVSTITTDLISKYIEKRQGEHAANGTINRELSCLQAMMRLGARCTRSDGKPMVERPPIFPPKMNEGRPRQGFIEDRQFESLAAHAKEPWMRAFIECAYSFGFRKSELLNLRRNQVDLLGRWIRLSGSDTKNGEPRAVKMTNQAFELLRVCCRGKQDTDYVFTREDGNHVVDPRQDWYDLCRAAKLGRYVEAKRRNGKTYDKYEGLIIHDFRRSAIRNMKRRGITDTVAMKISGHNTRDVFDRYNITDERDLEQASELIEAGRKVTVPQSQTHTKLIQPNFSVS